MLFGPGGPNICWKLQIDLHSAAGDLQPILSGSLRLPLVTVSSDLQLLKARSLYLFSFGEKKDYQPVSSSDLLPADS